jgi:hypothetical protein
MLSFARKQKVMRAVRGLTQWSLMTQTPGLGALAARIEQGLVEPTPDEELRIRIALDFPVEMDSVIEQLASGGFTK